MSTCPLACTPARAENLDRDLDSPLRGAELLVDVIRQGSQRGGCDDRSHDHRLASAIAAARAELAAQHRAFQALVGNNQDPVSPVARRSFRHCLGRLPAAPFEQQDQCEQAAEAGDEHHLADEQSSDLADQEEQAEADRGDCDRREGDREADQVRMDPPIKPPLPGMSRMLHRRQLSLRSVSPAHDGSLNAGFVVAEDGFALDDKSIMAHRHR